MNHPAAFSPQTNNSPIQQDHKHNLCDKTGLYSSLENPLLVSIISNMHQQLSSGKLTTLHHSGILFLEALSQSGRTLEMFVDTAKDTAFLSGDQGFGSEVIDTVIEAALYETGVHLNQV